MARILEIALDVDGNVREVRLALAPGGLESASGFVGVAHDLQSLAATAGRRLDRDRPAQLAAETADLLRGFDRLRHAGHDRHAGGQHSLARLDLRAHRVDRVRRWADPHDTGVAARARELRVLRE